MYRKELYLINCFLPRVVRIHEEKGNNLSIKKRMSVLYFDTGFNCGITKVRCMFFINKTDVRKKRNRVRLIFVSQFYSLYNKTFLSMQIQE